MERLGYNDYVRKNTQKINKNVSFKGLSEGEALFGLLKVEPNKLKKVKKIKPKAKSKKKKKS